MEIAYPSLCLVQRMFKRFQEYTQKLKFLPAMWLDAYLNHLAPRAALLVEGTAFKKVSRPNPAKLRVSARSGVALLVNAIGGFLGRHRT